jgi:hypothetical protein
MSTRGASPRHPWWFHLIAMGLVVLIAFGVLLCADVYLHYRLARYAAVNVWGYRGPVLGRKHSGDRRILMIGPSTVFGVNVTPEDAIPARLEQQLHTHAPHPTRVVNLGFPGEDAFAYRADLEDYLYLKPDAVIFYGDSNQSGAATPIVLRRLSPVFRWTGYYPVIDTALREKAMAMQHGGDIAGAYRGDKIVFRGGIATRTGAVALAGAASFAEAVHRVIGPLTVAPEKMPTVVATCTNEYAPFCDAMNNAVSYARALGLPVLVVNQPYVSDRQITAQQAIQGMLRERFRSDRMVRYLDLGWAIDLHDSRLSFDGEHLMAEGNEIVAQRLLQPSLDLLSAASH